MAIAFDIGGPIAMYRRPYTTTSSVSFPMPPPTAIAGLLGAITGLVNGSHELAYSAKFWGEVKETKIAISILNPIKWYTGTINFWNLKEPQKSPHIRVKHQFVKNPKYRIYVHGGLEEDLQKHLQEGTFIYTPYLGTAYALANIEYLGEFKIQPVNAQKISLSSVLPMSEQQDVRIDIAASEGVFRDRVPFRLTTNRDLCETINTIYSTNPKVRIHLTSWEGLDVTQYGNECIAWFPAW